MLLRMTRSCSPRFSWSEAGSFSSALRSGDASQANDILPLLSRFRGLRRTIAEPIWATGGDSSTSNLKLGRKPQARVKKSKGERMKRPMAIMINQIVASWPAAIRGADASRAVVPRPPTGRPPLKGDPFHRLPLPALSSSAVSGWRKAAGWCHNSFCLGYAMLIAAGTSGSSIRHSVQE